MKKIQKSGITIVTLVITVIILVILTGAVMLTMVGDNGIFRETQTTIDKYNKQAMLEQIQLKIQYKRLAKVNEGQYSLNLSEDILPILETFGTYNESEMKLSIAEKNIDIYLYEIINIPINEIANVTYTNQELTISEKVQLPNGYTFEYTKDNGITWSEYTSATTITEENGILIRLKNEEGKVVSSEYKVTSGVIEEIDSTKPIISIDTNGVTTGKTIKVTIIVTDEKGLDRNNTYEYCISTSNNDTTGATWIPYTNGISFTVGEGLTGGYYIHVKGVTDTAGNESENKVSEMLTFDNTMPSISLNMGRITDTSIEVLAQSTDNSGQVKSTEYSIDNGATWKTANTFTNLTQNTEYTVKVKSVDIFNNENIEEKQVTTNPRTWNGKIDISWYTKDPNKTTFDISTPNELAGLALLVDNEIAYYDDPHDANNTSGTYSIVGSEFEGKTIVLNNDIDLNYGTTIEYEETTGLVNIDVKGNKYTIGTGVDKYVDSNNELQTISTVSTEGQIRNSSGTVITEIPNLNQWTPIGIYEEGVINRPFRGIFDGNNYTIRGMYINVDEAVRGLFGIIENSNIKNINIGNSYLYSMNPVVVSNLLSGEYEGYKELFSKNGYFGNFVGGVCGIALNSSVDSCYSNVICQGSGNIGGIVGFADNCVLTKNTGMGFILVSYVENLGSSDYHMGYSVSGICGFSQNDTHIKECFNEAFVIGLDNIGGICGRSYEGVIESCENNGKLLQADSWNTGMGGVGGILGFSTLTTINKCINNGNLISNGEVGGIVCSESGTWIGTSVNECKNFGNITAIPKKESTTSIGAGIMGRLGASNPTVDMNSSINNCMNYGQINAIRAGGIAGAIKFADIVDCYNEANVNGENHVGGIVAWALGTNIINSVNLTNVYGKETGYAGPYVGGIIGAVAGNSKISNCFNKGRVCSENSYAGGIFSVVGNFDGDYKDNILLVNNCYNIGNVDGNSNAGGIGGNAMAQSVQINNSYNLSSNIVATSYGGIFGGFGHVFPEVVHSVTNCYSVDTTYFGTTVPIGSTVTNTGLINADGTFPNATPYADLLTALNAWVNENKQTYLDTYNIELKNWVMGSNGYPTFAE